MIFRLDADDMDGDIAGMDVGGDWAIDDFDI